MRPAGSFGQVAALFLGISSIATASWPGILPHRDALVARADPTTESTATKTDVPESTITKGPALTTGNLNTAVNTKSGSQSGGSKGNSTTTKKTFDARLPAGGVSMILPVTTTLVLYKLGDFVTLSWNYTSLLASPTAVDVMAVDASATQTHTLTQNMTFESPASYTWDTESYQEENAVSKPLRVAQYTLLIYDSDAEPTGIAAAGYLAPYNQLQFGIYTPQPYEPLGSWVCAVCNAAPKAMASGTARLAVTLALSAGVALAIL